MVKRTFVICDSCESRDSLEHPPRNNIHPVTITMAMDDAEGSLLPKTFHADLCEGCRRVVADEIAESITRASRKAGQANAKA